ncbi:MAG TPA: DUF1573 domain-containing protein [Verrucomicrobiae bacterium]
MTGKFFCIICVVVVTAKTCAASAASFNWDSESKATNIIAGANEAHFTFNFTNVSSTNVTILSVHPSCGCTTAQLPPLPWTISSGANGQIGVTVNLAGKSGTVLKTVTVNADKGMTMLSVKITMLSPEISPAMSDAGRAQNMKMAIADRQAVFKGDCISCHVKAGDGKFGKELYDADCAICHEGGNRATMVPNLHSIPQTTDVEFWRTWISYGRPHSLMPAFADIEGGPLTDAQIVSLATYLNTAIPSHR